jgi:hypothetical protein
LWCDFNTSDDFSFGSENRPSITPLTEVGGERMSTRTKSLVPPHLWAIYGSSRFRGNLAQFLLGYRKTFDRRGLKALSEWGQALFEAYAENDLDRALVPVLKNILWWAQQVMAVDEFASLHERRPHKRFQSLEIGHGMADFRFGQATRAKERVETRLALDAETKSRRAELDN